MSDKIFKGVTTKERIDQGYELLSKFPKLESYFGKEWLNILLQPGIETENVHPMYWYLTNSLINERLARALKMLAETSASYNKFIDELKSAKTHGEFIGSLREVETYYILREKGYDVTWKPKIKVGDKILSPDILINWEIPIYLEIFVIVDSDADSMEQKAEQLVQVGINKMEENSFAISTSYKQIISSEDVEPILDFIRGEIPTIKILSGEIEKRTLQKEGKDLVRIDFHKIDGLKGWIGGGGPMRSIDDSGRIKNKILDKIQAFQLPKKESTRHLNGYLIFLESSLSSSYSVATAVLGQETISFPVPMQDNVDVGREPILGRAGNGVVHHNSWNETIAANLDFISSTTNSNGEILGKNSFLLINEDSKIDLQKLQNLLFTGFEN